MTFNKQLRHINLALPEELLAIIDEEAKAHCSYCSEYIRKVLRAVVRDREKFMEHKNSPPPTKWLDTDDS